MREEKGRTSMSDFSITGLFLCEYFTFFFYRQHQPTRYFLASMSRVLPLNLHLCNYLMADDNKKDKKNGSFSS